MPISRSFVMSEELERLRRRLERERAARAEAERLLEGKADELFESLERAREGERLLNSALNSMSDGLLLTDDQNNVILSNEQLRLLYPEFARHLSPGNNLAGHFDLLLDNSDYRAASKGKLPTRFFELSTDDGRTLSVGVRLTREGWISSTHRDISDAKEREEERRSLLVDLLAAQRMESIGKMSGMIAHDFNNIIASIKGYAGFLDEDLPGEGYARESVRRILSATERAAGLIEQILVYGKQRQLPKHPVSVVPVLEDCRDMAVANNQRAFAPEFDAPEAPLWVRGDESQLSRLFTNLMNNAIQSLETDDGTVDLFVEEVESFDADSTPSPERFDRRSGAGTNHAGVGAIGVPCVKVTVADNGCGIDSEVIDRIFDLYFTTRSADRNVGLGMASVADVVTDMGGCVRVTSRPGTGTAIEVVLPITTPEAPTGRVEKEPSDAGNAATAAEVLVIDDEEDVGLLIVGMLERDGISATCITAPQLAEQLLLDRPDRWQLVICDQIMGSYRGSDLLHRLRDSDIRIPFILCSARIDTADSALLDELGDRFIPKPIDRDQLLNTVRRHLPTD